MGEDGRKVAAYATILNSVLVFIKGGLAIFSGSTAILTETIHSLTDVIGNLTVLIGITISAKKSPNFPWGLYKVENIAAIISAFFIFLMAYEIGRDTLLYGTKEIRSINVSIIAMLLMIIPVYSFFRYEKKKAAELNSPSLKADAKHWITDIASMGVVIGGLAGTLVYPYADKIAAIIVIIFILRAGFGILKDSMKSLLDASVDNITLNKIRETVDSFKEVEKITALNARNSGRFIFVNLDLRLSVKRLKDAHQISNAIEKAIRKEIHFVERVIIHYEPEKKDYVRYAVPLADEDGEISGHFGGAPFIALWDERFSDAAVVFREIVGNPFIRIEKGKGIRLAEFLVDRGVEVAYVKERFEGKGPEYVFSNAEVAVRITDLKLLEELIELKKNSHQ
jgi:cation diffusion facilitator family transporter